MKTDIEIAQDTKIRPISEIASELGLDSDDYAQWGDHKAKVKLDLLKKVSDRKDGHLVLVTTMNPTPRGEGKTTVAIGLSQALNRIGKKAIVGIRQPSLGPTMGMKGGAAGGGRSQVLPMEDINLHFTGDMHAITAAHNLLSALINNHIHYGNELGMDNRHIRWHRVLDITDRALRNVIVGLGGRAGGVPHECRFDITAASEIMAILCLATDLSDLKERLARMVVGYTTDDTPVTAADLKGVGAMTLLLKDAMRPNLVQTIEGGPAFIHGGPFANIAHGTSSLISTKLGLKLCEYYVTEAGFGSDLGAEKFFNIVCRVGGLKPSAVVLIATIKALKYHGGPEGDIKLGFENLKKHLSNIRKFGVPVVVTINEFEDDTEADLADVERLCAAATVPVARNQVYMKGGAGGEDLARKVVATASSGQDFRHLYPLHLSVRQKIETIAKVIYGAERVVFNVKAEKEMASIEGHGFGNLPVCMAKTQYSLTDDPKVRGRPENFKITVRDLDVAAGAGFIIAYTGDISTMPGLPREPAATRMDIEENGRITGLF